MTKSSRFAIFSGVIAGACALAAGWLSQPAQGQIAVRNQGYVPFSEEPIDYRSENLTDPVARLQKQLASGAVKLDYEPRHGYLRSVLEKLRIPASSQTLVFSKTSFQYKKISPKEPRALYFNDDVYVGQVHEGKVLEFVSFDPAQGAIFYILDEQKAEKPVFQRAELDCTQCHVAAGTRGVPGVLLRSVVTTPSGTQALKTAAFITGQESPLKERWGGWYVTSKQGGGNHMGNTVKEDNGRLEPPAAEGEGAPAANVTDLSAYIDTSAFLNGDSDIVAHLVLAHQTQMHNLITLTNYQTRLALYKQGESAQGPLSGATQKQYQEPAEQLLRYLLFTNEAPLDGPVAGTSGYAAEFEALGPRDARGRSLRDFDLRTRIFRYPCSYLIYSESFDSLPEPAKTYIYHRLLEILTGKDQSPDFSRLTAADRRAVLEILLATKPGLPEEWTKYKPSAQAVR